MKFLRALFLRNVGLKIMSFLLAFLLWMQISGQETVQRIVSAPIVFVNLPPGLEITGDFQTTVDIVIRTERPSMPLEVNRLTVIVDLSGAKPGEQVIPLNENNVANKPTGVEIANLLTSRLRLRLERVERKTLEVKPQLVGKPAAGFEITEIIVTPASATLVGPETRLRRIQGIATEPIDIQDASDTVSQSVYLNLPDLPVRIEGPQQVAVTVRIMPKDQSPNGKRP